MKGIILAGGTGSRLYPITISTSKQLLPIYDKPMIYYPLATLMQAGIREILIISTPHDVPRFQALLGDGSHLGLTIEYASQPKPEGIAQSFLIGENFIGNDSVALILGDNIFHGYHLQEHLSHCHLLTQGGIIFAYLVKNPTRYGVVAFDDHHEIIDIVEKPQKPPSNYAVTGLYFYDAKVISFAKRLTPSWRKELEITDLNRLYLKESHLEVRLLDRGFAWLDTGTSDAFQKASQYIQTIQERQGIKIGCIEEIAYQMGFITLKEFTALAKKLSSSEYGDYLRTLAQKMQKPLSFIKLQELTSFK